MGQVINMQGMKCGRWTVIEQAATKSNKVYWLCECDCGTIREVVGKDMRSGKSTSCGCISAEKKSIANFVHGYTTGKISLTYKTWASMKERCTNPNSRVYSYYGGRGITICERWINSFVDFVDDMGDRPSKDYSLDRINVNGNYEPSNCRWATNSEQRINTRQRKSKSGIRGVSKNPRCSTWKAVISFDKKRIIIGNYRSIEEAAAARKEAEIKYWGKSS